jgi:hypothetical protein
MQELDEQLRASPGLIQAVMGELEAAGLVGRVRSRWRYAATGDRDHLVGELERAFTERPLAVVRLIASGPDRAAQAGR